MSADWMYRNLSTRVEVVTPILERADKEKLWGMLDVCLRNRRQAWVLGADGRYSKVTPDGEAQGTRA